MPCAEGEPPTGWEDGTGAQPLSDQLHCHQGNEIKQIQTTGNAAKASRSESSRACECCNPSLSAEIGSLFPPVCCRHGSLLLARKKLTHPRAVCFYSALGCTSQRTLPSSTAGAVMVWDFSKPSLTYTQSFPRCHSCTSVL